MNFFQQLFFNLFINPRKNEILYIHLFHEHIKDSLDYLPKESFSISFDNYFEWLILQEKMLNGSLKSPFLKELNSLFIETIIKQNKITPNSISNAFPFSHKEMFFNDNTLYVFNTNTKDFIPLNFNHGNQNLKTLQNFLFWIIGEYFFNNLVNKKPRIITTLFSYIQSIHMSENAYVPIFTLIKSLHKYVTDKKEVLTPKNETTPIKNITNLPLLAQEKLQLIFHLLNDSNLENLTGEDKHVIEQIRTSYISNSVDVYFSMPEKFRDNMKNNDGLTMTELLISNLDKYILIINDINQKQLISSSENLLKQQTIYNKIAEQKFVNRNLNY